MESYVLVVDDNPSNLKLAGDVLESEGFRVQRASNAEEALMAFDAEAPGVVLLDLALPGMDGFSLARALRARPDAKATRVVAMTAYAMRGDEQRALAAGCDGYIAKPIDTRKLPSQVAEYARGKRVHFSQSILIVEDIATNRKLLRVTLEAEGHRVFEANDGVEALAILERESVDAIISDILMPNMDGYRLCYEIRSSERWFKLPFIIYTNTYTSPGDEQVALELGADRYLRKPSPPHAILEALIEATNSSAKRAPTRIRRPEGLELLKSYSGRLVAKLEERNAELQRHAEALRQSNQTFADLTSHLPQAFWLGSLDRSELFYVSPAYETLFGRSCESLIQQPTAWLDAVHPADRARVEAVAWARKGREHDEEYRIVLPDGTERWIRDRAFIIRNQAGHTVRLAGLADDVSERKLAEQTRARLEAELRQAQKLEVLGTLASSIAHDFNNILTAILGNAELARVRLASQVSANEQVSEIIQASLRAVDLTRQILGFGRRHEAVRESVSLEQVVVEVLKLLRASLPAHVSIRADRPRDIPLVWADPSQVHQVLMNLCSNAAHAMRERGGTIEIHQALVSVGDVAVHEAASLKPANYVRLDVRDDGQGMDEATLQRIFDPFFTTKARGTGTGLGLAVVRGIMEDHGGAVRAESHVGRGSTFSLYFPVAPPASVPVRREARVPTGNGERILVVDEEESIASLTSEALNMLGYRAQPMKSAFDALRCLEEAPNEVDLVLTDLSMPAMSGLELAAELRRRQPRLPVVLATGYELSLAPGQAEALAPCVLLSKPFKAETLADSVARALALVHLAGSC